MKKSIVLSLCLCLILLIGCATDDRDNAITDKTTKSKPQVINEIPEGMNTVEYKLDNMSRNRYQYHFTEDGELLINPNVGIQDLDRGDILYFKMPEYSNPNNPNLNLSEYNISRVVALPGESIEIKDGQIYIDDKKLEAFYGQKNKYGFTKEEYIKFNKEEDPSFSLSEEELVFFNESMDEIQLSKGQIFVIGDNWWRGVDSRLFGPLEQDAVEGKVIGVTKDYTTSN